MTDSEYHEIAKHAADKFLKIPGVHSVGIGSRFRKGKPTGEIVLKVYLVNKKFKKDVPEAELIPEDFEGIPTDVVECGRFTPASGPGGIAEMTQEQRWQNRDRARERPLIGGCLLQVKLPGRSSVGTLGCLLDRIDDNSKVYALTNHHVLFGSGNPGVADTRVGQPTNRDSCTQCCSDLFGTFKEGQDGADVDAAIVELDAGQKWKAEIKEIGVIAGSHSVTVAEAGTGTYQVRKRGATTHLTGGVVDSIGAVISSAGFTIANGVIIRPNPVPGNPSATPFFTQHGDSGSVIVNEDNEVISLHYGASYDSSSTQHGFASGIAIDHVLTWLQGRGYSTLKVATATAPDDERTVPASAFQSPEPGVNAEIIKAPVPKPAAIIKPETVPAFARNILNSVTIENDDVLKKLDQDITRSERGQLLRSLWLSHQEEVLNLINKNKRVAVVWHRSGAAELVQHVLNTLYSTGKKIPALVQGKSISSIFQKIYEVFMKFGSELLKSDLKIFRTAVPVIGGLTYNQILKELEK